MFDFLYTFFLDAKKKHLAVQRTGFWSKNLLNYKNYKTMSQLVVLINGLGGIAKSKVLLTSNRFGPETFFSKWVFLVLCLSPLFLILL